MTNSITNNKPLDAEVVHMPIIEANDGMKKSTETYQQWGTRRAGMTHICRGSFLSRMSSAPTESHTVSMLSNH